jgi:hypothetical protein
MSGEAYEDDQMMGGEEMEQEYDQESKYLF